MARIKKDVITSERRSQAESQIFVHNRITKYDTVDYAIDYLVEKLIAGKETAEMVDGENSSIGRFVIPSYQRNSVWSDKDRSAFIESILLGLPIPFLFFCERENGIIEIVDGVQRITTLNSFINNNFVLKDLTKLEKLNGFKFEDFSESTQRRFGNKTLRVILLDSDTPVESRQDLFSRVNKSGRRINPSEFRRGTFPGRLTQFIERCSGDPLFVSLCPLSEGKVERYARFELVLRFFAFVNEYKDVKHDVTPFLDKFLQKNQNTFNELEYKGEFDRMCLFVEKHFELGFARSKQSVPNVRFEAISVGVALALRENPDLTTTKDSVESWLDSLKFKELTTTDASNNPGRLVARVEYVRDCLLGRGNEQNL